jgi:hypothetical protein
LCAGFNTPVRAPRRVDPDIIEVDPQPVNQPPPQAQAANNIALVEPHQPPNQIQVVLPQERLTLFSRLISKCAIRRNQHVRICNVKYYVLGADDLVQYQLQGTRFDIPCACGTTLPYTALWQFTNHPVRIQARAPQAPQQRDDDLLPALAALQLAPAGAPIAPTYAYGNNPNQAPLW